MPLRLSVLLALFFVSSVSMAQQWSSQGQQTDVIELFTSEGCSSCPPADRWLSELKHHPGLFKTFVPLAFHVDYWDWLGWKDKLAKASFSERQRRYAREGLISQVYTPGLIVNSAEWRAWFRGARQWDQARENPGTLLATHNDGQLQVDFAGPKQNYDLNIAFLGMGIASAVQAGENKGKQFLHDFVVLDLMTIQGRGEWHISMPEIPDAGQRQTAVAIWVSDPRSLAILQAVGGYL